MTHLLESPDRFGSPCKIDPTWRTFDNAFECRVVLCPEDEGGYSAHALRLPGVVSQGETAAEALDNIREAFAAAIETYRELGKTIPWADVEVERAKGTIERWLLVDV